MKKDYDNKMLKTDVAETAPVEERTAKVQKTFHFAADGFTTKAADLKEATEKLNDYKKRANTKE
jgi:hypothetical protein